MGEGDEREEVVGHGRRRFATMRMVVLLVAVLVAVCALLIWLRSPPDPLYKGRRFSTYLNDALRRTPEPGLSPTQRYAMLKERNEKLKEARAAAFALGPEAIPLLPALTNLLTQPRTAVRETARAFNQNEAKASGPASHRQTGETVETQNGEILLITSGN